MLVNRRCTAGCGGLVCHRLDAVWLSTDKRYLCSPPRQLDGSGSADSPRRACEDHERHAGDSSRTFVQSPNRSDRATL